MSYIIVDGAKATADALLAIDKNLRYKLERQAVMAGLKVPGAVAKRRAPRAVSWLRMFRAKPSARRPYLEIASYQRSRRSGILRASLGYKTKKFKGSTFGIFGARQGFAETVLTVDGRLRRIDPVHYAHLADLGRREVVPTRKRALANFVMVLGTRAQTAIGSGFLSVTAKHTRSQTVRVVERTILAGLLP